jgi:uncharacterized protein YjiS (DUF1127 family)
MPIDLTLAIAPGRTLRLPDGAPFDLHVQSGRLWLTRCRDASDYFVGAGLSLTLDGRHDEVLVQCDSPDAARLRIQIPDALHLWAPDGAGVQVLARQVTAVPGALQRLIQGLLQRAITARRNTTRALPELDEHLLRDIGAHPALWQAARGKSYRQHLQLLQARLNTPG